MNGIKGVKEMKDFYKEIEYQMVEEVAATLLKSKPKKMDKQKYLCDYVNNTYGLLGKVVYVHTI